MDLIQVKTVLCGRAPLKSLTFNILKIKIFEFRFESIKYHLQYSLTFFTCPFVGLNKCRNVIKKYFVWVSFNFFLIHFILYFLVS